jgi:hypothetical protein
VAGDVCESVDIFRATFVLLLARFGVVFWVCGNHELYLDKEGRAQGLTSLDKLKDLLRICDELGVFTSPCHVEDRAHPRGGKLWIVPLLSWHHASFDTETDITSLDAPPIEKLMRDFHSCRWPDYLNAMDESVAQHFDAMNDLSIFTPDLLVAAKAVSESARSEVDTPLYPFVVTKVQSWAEIRRSDGSSSVSTSSTSTGASDDIVISLSHFLPRLELCPEKRFLYYPHLPKAVGSRFLGERVAR